MMQSTVTDMVDTKTQHKLAKSEKEIADRKSREKNIIMFSAGEPDTNLIEDSLKSDKEFVGKYLMKSILKRGNTSQLKKL